MVKLELLHLTDSKPILSSTQNSHFDSTFNSLESSTLLFEHRFDSRLHDLESNVGDFNWSRNNHTLYDLYCKHNHRKGTFNDICEKFHNFKKYVRDFLGLDTPARLNSSDMHSSGDDGSPCFLQACSRKNNQSSRSSP